MGTAYVYPYGMYVVMTAPSTVSGLPPRSSGNSIRWVSVMLSENGAYIAVLSSTARLQLSVRLQLSAPLDFYS